MNEATATPADTSAPPAAPAATPSPLPVEPASSRARGRLREPAPAAPEAAAPTEPAKPERPKADEWAKLTAAEKRQRKERETFDAERRAFGEERKNLDAQKERLALIDRAKSGDWEAREKLLAETGLTYDQLTKRALNAGKVDKGETALERIDRLEKELKERDERAAQEAEQLTFAQTVDTFVMHVTKESPDAYPILAGEIEVDRPRIELVLREMLAASREANKPLTYAEAASRYEAHLRAETDRRVARLRPAPAEAAPAAPAPKTSTETRPRDETGRFAGGDGPRRLTNRDSAERTLAPPVSTPSQRMTQRERDAQEREQLRRAAAAMPRRSA